MLKTAVTDRMAHSSEVIKEQLENLLKLQEVESEMARIQRILEQTPAKIEAIDAKLGGFEARMADEASVLERLKKEYRAKEADVRARDDIIKKSQVKLRSVKTNKEYQSILKEIEDMKRKNSGIEDVMLSELDQMEAAEKEMTARKSEYEAAKAAAEAEKKAFLEDAKKEEDRLVLLKADYDQAAAYVLPDFLERYNQVKGRESRIGVVSVNDAVCSGCTMKIPPQMFIELQRFDALKFCPFCNKIMYYKEKE